MILKLLQGTYLDVLLHYSYTVNFHFIFPLGQPKLLNIFLLGTLISLCPCSHIDILLRHDFVITTCMCVGLRPCLQGERITLVLGLPYQEGYPSSRIFLLFSHDVFTRQVGLP